MKVRCPHCHNPIDLIDDNPLSDIECSSCHSTFHLITSQATETYSVKTKRIAHFELLDQVGMGKFGAVWKARDTELDRIVAVKIPRMGQLDDDEAEQFLREARAAAQVNHPHIVSVHEVGREENTFYIVSDFIEGASLQEWLTAERPAPQEAAQLCAAIAEALHAAHEAGVVHRDLKPGNIMMDLERNPHVADFGLAKRDAGEITMTVDGKILGTPAYMPPEQASGKGHQADRRADVYSLGVILYELLTGELPFRGQSRMLIVQIQQDEPTPPRKLDQRIPRDLETICLKCMEKDPARRYQTAQDVGADLHRYLRGEAVSARPISQLERTWRWARHHPARAALLATVVVAMAAFAGLGVGYTYQQQLEDKNVQLSRANQNLETSLDREQQLSGQLAESLSQTEGARQAEAKAKDQLDQVLYFRQVTLALSEWKDGRITRARNLLEKCPAERRHWEWHYTHGICHPEFLTLTGHGRAYSVAFSPDGTRIASGGNDGTVRLWDAQDGRELSTFKARGDEIWSVRFSPDGDRLASGGQDDSGRIGVVEIWDTSSGQKLHTLEAHTSIVWCIAFSPTGDRIASGSGDETVTIWDTETGQKLITFMGHSSTERIGNEVIGVAFSPDGKRIVSGGEFITREPIPYASPDVTRRPMVKWGGALLKVWNAHSGKELMSLEGHTHMVQRVAFSPDGKRIVSASLGDKIQGVGGTVKVWDAESGQEIHSLSHPQGIVGVTFSPDGKQIASGGEDGIVRLWDADSGQELHAFKGHLARDVNEVAFSPDGKYLASASHDGSVRVWDVKSRPAGRTRTLEGHTDHIFRLAFSPNGRRVVSASQDRSAKVWDAETGQQLFTLKGHANSVHGLAFSADGKRIATSTSAGKVPTGIVKMWDIETGEETLTISAPAETVHRVTFSSDGSRIASSSFVWDAKTGRKLASLKGNTERRSGVAFSHDGKRIASGMKGAVKIWDAGNGQELLTLRGNRVANIRWIAFSPDNKRLVSTSGWPNDQVARVWDLQTGGLLFMLHGHTGEVSSIAFSPDGNHIISGSSDQTAKVWDAESGQEIRTLVGHEDDVRGVAFSVDGRRIVTGSLDNTMKLWDATSGSERFTFDAGSGRVTAIAISADAQRIATANDDQTITVWDTDKGQELIALSGFPSPVWGIAFSPDGKRIAAGWTTYRQFPMATVNVWDADTGEQLSTFSKRDRSARGLARSVVTFSPDGKRVACESVVWDMASGQEIFRFKGHTAAVTCVAFSPNGNRVARASTDESVKILDATNGQELLTLRHDGAVQTVVFSPDGTQIAGASGRSGVFKTGGNVKVWDVASGGELLSLEGQAASVAFSPDGKRIAGGNFGTREGGTVRIWDTRSGREVLAWNCGNHHVRHIAFSPDGKRIASASASAVTRESGNYNLSGPGGVIVWQADSGRRLLELKGHTHVVDCVAFSPDAKRIATASWDKTVRVWDAESGQELLVLEGHTDQVSSVAFTVNGKRIVSGSEDETARLWDAESGQELLVLKGHSIPVSSVAVSSDGKRIVGPSLIWDIETGQPSTVFQGHSGEVNSMIFSPDGRLIATASQDKTIRVWDAEQGQELLTLKGHTGAVVHVAFNAAGEHIASASSDGTVKVWDTRSGNELTTLNAHLRGVSSVAFSADGQRIVTGGTDGVVKLWDAGSGQEVLTITQDAPVQSVFFGPQGRRVAAAAIQRVASALANRQTVKVWIAEIESASVK